MGVFDRITRINRIGKEKNADPPWERSNKPQTRQLAPAKKRVRQKHGGKKMGKERGQRIAGPAGNRQETVGNT
jgi:hypothetical protein